MIKRLFKLLYVFALSALVLSLPYRIMTSVDFSKVTISSYKAKCLSNNQYVVLQGAEVGEAVVMDEIYLEDSNNSKAIKEQLNFYCKYYDEIEPYIIAYNNAKTPAEQYASNIAFTQFENTKAKVFAYPELYKLELVGEEKHFEEIYYPFFGWLIGAIIAFIILQILRMSYIYVAFGKVVWHPFKQSNKKDNA